MVITGSGFVAGATVTFGGVDATSLVVTPTQISGLTPAHASGYVDVKVTNPDTGSATLNNGFLYVDPVFTDCPDTKTQSPPVSADICPGGHIKAGPQTTPPFRQINVLPPPLISELDPMDGPLTGRDGVFIKGFFFMDGAVASFGGISTPTTVIDAFTLHCFTPPHAVGAVDVVVANPDLQTGTFTGGYTYTHTPLEINSVSPIEGNVAGAETVMVKGSNFRTDATVKFVRREIIDDEKVEVSSSPSPLVTVSNSQTLLVETPEHSKGIVDIRVDNVYP